MNTLEKYPSYVQNILMIVKPVTKHFASIELPEDLQKQIKAAADKTFSDKLLLEKFVMWNDEKDDEVFLFHIKRFFEKREVRKLSSKERDLSFKRAEVESSIKQSARSTRGQIFGERLTRLAIENNLITNKALAEFLEIAEDEARRLKSGKHCPQTKTIKRVSDKFEVAMGYLVGLTEDSTR